MTESTYKSILCPINQCPLTGLERQVLSERLGNLRITITLDHWRQYRITLKDISSDTYISGIIFDQFKTEVFRYTLPMYRGNNYTNQLFVYICNNISKRFKHSEHLTIDGKHCLKVA